MPTTVVLTPGQKFRDRFIGDKEFYQRVLSLVVPVIIQNTVSNVVNLLDNVMVGALGTTHMSGVAIANELIFVFHLAIFGALSGAGIYGAQYAGAKDWEGVRQTLRARLVLAVTIVAAGIIILSAWGNPLAMRFLRGEGSAADAHAMLQNALAYLGIMIIGFLPFAITQCYSGVLRETGETFLPMVSSLTAVLVNLVFNYLLIFGKFGFPALGVRGAAIATVLSRFVEMGIVVSVSHFKRTKFPFLKGVYRHFRVGKELAKNIARKGAPLFANEFFWSTGMITTAQIFSTRGLAVMAGFNIANTIGNLFSVFFLSTGTAVAVMTGQALGAGDTELARRQVWKILFFSISMCLVLSALLALFAAPITKIYNTEDDVRQLAVAFMRTNAFYMWCHATAHCCYFAIRSGGKTFITMLFDSVYTWLVVVPYTYALVTFTALPIPVLYPISHLTDLLKAGLGIWVVSTGFWAMNLVASGSEQAELTAD